MRRLSAISLFVLVAAGPMRAEAQDDPIHAGDKAALLELHAATNGPNWAFATNWTSGAWVEDWLSVVVENNRVIRLWLCDQGLEGQLPSSIGDLSALQTLSMCNNKLNGPLPPSINNLTELTRLEIDQNELTGTIPALNNLTKLETLFLGWNQFEGAVPDISGIATLTLAGFGLNQLDEMPVLSGLDALNVIFLNNNRFEPDDFEKNVPLFSTMNSFNVLLDEQAPPPVINDGAGTYSIDVPGVNNIYAWVKYFPDTESIGTIPEPNGTSTEFTPTEPGHYKVRITNSLLSTVAFFELLSESFFVESVPELMPTGRVTILGSDPPVPLSLARVTATVDNTVLETLTNAQGNYEFMLDPGTYTFNAEPRQEEAQFRIAIEQTEAIEQGFVALPDFQMGVQNRFEDLVLLTAGLEKFGNPTLLGFELPPGLSRPYEGAMMDIDAYAITFPDPPVATSENLYRLHLSVRATDRIGDGAKDLSGDFGALFIDFAGTIAELGDLNKRFTSNLTKASEKLSGFVIGEAAIEASQLKGLLDKAGGRVSGLFESMRSSLIDVLISAVTGPDSNNEISGAAAIRKSIELVLVQYFVSKNKPEDVVKGIPSNYSKELFTTYYGKLTEETVNSSLLAAQLFSPANEGLVLDQFLVNEGISSSRGAYLRTVNRMNTSYDAAARDLAGQVGSAAEIMATAVTPFLLFPATATIAFALNEALVEFAKITKAFENVLKGADMMDAGFRLFVFMPDELNETMARAYALSTLRSPSEIPAGKRVSRAVTESSMVNLSIAANEYEDALLSLKQIILTESFESYVDVVGNSLINAGAERDVATRGPAALILTNAAATVAVDTTVLPLISVYTTNAMAFDGARAVLYLDLLSFMFDAATFSDLNDPAYIARRESLFASIEGVLQMNADLTTQLTGLITEVENLGTLGGALITESLHVTSGPDTLTSITTSPQIFTLTASLRNLSDQTITGANASVPDIDPTLGVNFGTSQDVSVPAIAPGDMVQVDWNMTFSGSMQLTAVPLSVSLASSEIKVSSDFRILFPVTDIRDGDDDGLPDGYEEFFGLDPGNPDGDGDADNDGLLNLAEYFLGTNPSSVDSDGDGFSDGEEVAAGSNALDPSKTPDGDVNVSREPRAEIPSGYTLMQNYPNPFNPVTTIEYTLSAPVHTSLVVYDLLGRRIETLVDAAQNTGHHRVQFDASGLPSGVYFYRLVSSDFIETRRMVLLK